MLSCITRGSITRSPPLFALPLHMGIRGAALAAVIAQNFGADDRERIRLGTRCSSARDAIRAAIPIGWGLADITGRGYIERKRRKTP